MADSDKVPEQQQNQQEPTKTTEATTNEDAVTAEEPQQPKPIIGKCFQKINKK